jgi:ferritin-like metal-binding protein YciE
MDDVMAKSKSNQKQSPDANELLLTELREIYSAESQLSKVLPRLGKVVQSEKLQKMLDRRLEQGERIIDALEKGFEKMDTTPGRKKNIAAEGLISDAREHVQEIEAGPALDAVLIGAVQKTEHYCIAAWGTAKALAEAVEESEIVRVMDRALKEGKEYDVALTGLAESEVTPALLSMAEESDEGADEEARSSSSHKSRASGRRAAR